MSRFRPLLGRLWGVYDTLLRPGTYDPSKYRCDPPTGHVWGFKKRICIRHRQWRMVGHMRYAPTTEYVCPFKKLSRFRLLRGRLWGICDTPLRPGMCGPSKNCPVFVPFGDAYGAYAIRPYDRIRAALRNTDAIPQLGTCCPSKNYPVFATVGGVWWGVCDTPLQLGTCCPSKNCLVFVPFGVAGWGVCNTPLQPSTGGPSKNDSVFVPFGAVCGVYAIHPYNRVCAILQNTDAMPQPGTCDPSKYRCNSPTGYV